MVDEIEEPAPTQPSTLHPELDHRLSLLEATTAETNAKVSQLVDMLQAYADEMHSQRTRLIAVESELAERRITERAQANGAGDDAE